MSYCNVILRGAVKQTDVLYTYKIPETLEGKVVPGCLCSVPFGKGNRLKTALVTEVTAECSSSYKVKDVSALVSDIPVVTDDQLAILDKIASRYNCTRGEAAELMIPSCVETHKNKSVAFVEIADKAEAESVLREGSLRSSAHINILEYLLENGPSDRKEVLYGCRASASQLKAVIDKGLVRSYKTRAEDSEVTSEFEFEDVPDRGFTEEHDLNTDQQNAVKKIMEGDKTVYLLYGITGSGKTEVYLNCARQTIENGGSVLYMVPEISLTPQSINWIRGRLGDSVAVLHSRLTDNQRYVQWDRIRRGIARIVVAPRSGVFAPIPNLKLIVIDEEHDGSYRSETHPRYSAKEIARMRSSITGAKIILGSATPSIESFYAATHDVYEMVELKTRARKQARLPETVPVDMKEQIKLGSGEMLSVPLRQAISVALSERKQIMLFLNRRGYSRTLVCSDCGTAATCVNCSVAMTLHNNKRTGKQNLVCHYCGYTIPADTAECSSCGGIHFTRAGFGTQQLEELIRKLYPTEKVLRMDQDTTMSPKAYRDIIDSFAAGEASFLIGTQMIAKGHDFPNVTVVGILGADLMLASSSYRASERAFQLITQAAGRAGRADAPGKVFVQSYRPDLPLFRYALTQDYEAFYKAEIEYREKLLLPPFKALGELILSDENEEDLAVKASELKAYLKDFLSYQDEKHGFELFGPMPDVIYELRGKYRMDFVIKATTKSALNAIYKKITTDFDYNRYQISFNNDPEN